MTTITKASWDKYIDDLRKVNQTAGAKMSLYLSKHPNWDDPEVRQSILDYAYSLTGKYGTAAAELACEMYDSMGLLSGLTLPSAEPAAIPTFGEVAKAVNGAMKQSFNIDLISSAVSRQVKLMGVDTTMQNALRDGAQFAWIPSGDTCAYCIMLASRGWQKASKKAIRKGHAEHVHANCDCTYAVRFDDKTDVEGYNNGDEYYDMFQHGKGIDEDIWEDADENTQVGAGKKKSKMSSQERVFLSAYRKQTYRDNSEKIKAQKREAYAKRKEQESSASI